MAGVQGFQVLGDNGQPVAPQAPQAPQAPSGQPAQPPQPPQPIQPFNLNSQENPAFASFMGGRQS